MTARCVRLDPLLIATLGRVSQWLEEATRPWWVIGSAAVALHGGAIRVTRDVDVLIDPADVAMLVERTAQAARAGEPDDRFRSEQVVAVSDQPLSVEMFADLHVREAGTWRPLRPMTREPIAIKNGIVFVPTAIELIDILLWFGRAKDLARADLLRRTLAKSAPDPSVRTRRAAIG